MIDITSATASSTATVCENMALYGAAPERGELDSRVVWDEHDAMDALSEAIRVIVDGITVDGTQMADEREALMWGFVNCLHSQVTRLDRAVDRIAPEMKDLEKAQDGSEVKAWELQTLTDRAQNLGDRRDAFEKMRDLAADAYRVETGEPVAEPQEFRLVNRRQDYLRHSLLHDFVFYGRDAERSCAAIRLRDVHPP